jgi:hypothetical protein
MKQTAETNKRWTKARPLIIADGETIYFIFSSPNYYVVHMLDSRHFVIITKPPGSSSTIYLNPSKVCRYYHHSCAVLMYSYYCKVIAIGDFSELSDTDFAFPF